MPLLSVKNLRMHFCTRAAESRAVQDVSFDLEKGEVLGLVGESGSGKSATCLSLLGLLPSPPARILSGSALFNGLDLLKLPSKQLRALRGRRISMVFQDPMSSLNPCLRIGAQLAEPLLIHGVCKDREARIRAEALLESVGISDASRRMRQYPHELSGGMRQRVMIAMALIAEPELLIADEPTTALDVTVQAQILELLRTEQRRRGMSVLYVTHDLAVVSGLCDRVQVMYAGRIVESAPVGTLYRDARHPYTRALQQSIPALQAKGADLKSIPGTPPDPTRPAQGCAFAPRCPRATASCVHGEAPPLQPVGDRHSHACPVTYQEGLAAKPARS